MKRFLIIQTAFLGDVILATPLIEKLHDLYPDSKIDFLLRKGNEDLLTDHPKLNRVFIWSKRKHKYLNLIKVIFQIRRKPYHMVINVKDSLIFDLDNVYYNDKCDKKETNTCQVYIRVLLEEQRGCSR